jgi:hypothetical protein
MATSIEGELSALERNLTTLRIDYERFFSGDLKQPPFAARRLLEGFLKRLGNSDIEKPVERSRLQAAQSRYTAMTELWEKRLAQKETGRVPGVRRGAMPQVPQEPPARDGARPASVQLKRRVDFTPLFQRYCAARQSLGEDVSRLKYERFEELVKKQAEDIKMKTGSSRLVFEVQVVEGRVRLIGRPAAPKG